MRPVVFTRNNIGDNSSTVNDSGCREPPRVGDRTGSWRRATPRRGADRYPGGSEEVPWRDRRRQRGRTRVRPGPAGGGARPSPRWHRPRARRDAPDALPPPRRLARAEGHGARLAAAPRAPAGRGPRLLHGALDGAAGGGRGGRRQPGLRPPADPERAHRAAPDPGRPVRRRPRTTLFHNAYTPTVRARGDRLGVGVGALLFGASAVLAQLKSALNTIWGATSAAAASRRLLDRRSPSRWCSPRLPAAGLAPVQHRPHRVQPPSPPSASRRPPHAVNGGATWVTALLIGVLYRYLPDTRALARRRPGGAPPCCSRPASGCWAATWDTAPSPPPTARPARSSSCCCGSTTRPRSSSWAPSWRVPRPTSAALAAPRHREGELEGGQPFARVVGEVEHR